MSVLIFVLILIFILVFVSSSSSPSSSSYSTPIMALFNFSRNTASEPTDEKKSSTTEAADVHVKEHDVESASNSNSDSSKHPPAYRYDSKGFDAEGEGEEGGGEVVFVDEQGNRVHTQLKRQLKARHIAMIR